ncbi:MAG: cytochrome P450, partial [Chloroflexota bacterium]
VCMLGPIGDVVLVSDPEMVRSLLIDHWQDTVKLERGRLALESVAVNNILTIEGDLWHRIRSLSQPAFHTQRVVEYSGLIGALSLKMLRSWGSDQVVEVQPLMVDVTLSVIADILFGVSHASVGGAPTGALDEITRAVITESRLLFVPPAWFPLRHRRRRDSALQLVETYIKYLVSETRRRGVDRGDVMSSLVFARLPDDQDVLTDQEIQDTLVSLYIGGHETTAQTLSWAFYELACNPSVQERVRTELLAVVAGEYPVYSEFERLTYFQQFVREVFRRYPAVYQLVQREVARSFVLGDVELPAGIGVLMSPYLMHHLDRFWSDPFVFDPERFAGDWRRRIPTYAYMPFGGGPRVCLGSYLAEMELFVVVGAVLMHYEVALVEQDQVVLPDAGFTLRPSSSLPLRFRRLTD